MENETKATGTTVTSAYVNDNAFWNKAILIDAVYISDKVQLYYRQSSCLIGTASRVYYIEYTCKHGKIVESEPIYGKIIPATEETYEFE